MATIIHICGIDGSGKTTLTLNSSKALKELGLKSEVLYLGGLHSFNYAIFPLEFFLRRIGVDVYQRRFSSIFSLIWPWTYVFVYSVYFFVKTRATLWLHRDWYIFFDRYTLDGVVELGVLGGLKEASNSLALRTLLRFPSPNVKIYLDVDIDTAYQRKIEEKHSKTWLETRRGYYQRLGRKLQYLQLDGSLPQKSLVEETLAVILNRQVKEA